jgi:hypothetical protein
MKTKITLSLLLSSLFILGYSQNDKPERDGFQLKLAVDSINFYEQQVNKMPYFVKEKVLQIYPTEKIFIEVDVNKSEIVSMKTVKENINPKKTITVELTQSTKNRKHELTMLKITNPFKKELKYKAIMYIVGHNKWIPTSTLPVEAKLITYETWDEVIITLVLSDWTLN